MKKYRYAGLVLLYLLLFSSIIGFQTMAFGRNISPLWMNLVTTGIGVIGAGGFWLIFHFTEKNHRDKQKHGENQIREDAKVNGHREEETGNNNRLPTEKSVYIQTMKQYNLTERELELGYLIVSGYSNARIAEELFIAESTVKKHTTHIYEKTGVTGRKEFKP